MTHDISIHNTSSQPITVSPYVEDAPASGLTTDTIQAHNPTNAISLTSWVHTDAPTYPIAPDSTTTVHVSIHVPATAPNGSHDGSILFFDHIPAPGEKIDDRVGTFILLDVPGDPNAAGSYVFAVGHVDKNQTFHSLTGSASAQLPLDFAIQTHNNLSNAKLAPTGSITITDDSGQTLTGIFSPDQHAIEDALPINPGRESIPPKGNGIYAVRWIGWPHSDGSSSGSLVYADLSGYALHVFNQTHPQLASGEVISTVPSHRTFTAHLTLLSPGVANGSGTTITDTRSFTIDYDQPVITRRTSPLVDILLIIMVVTVGIVAVLRVRSM